MTGRVTGISAARKKACTCATRRSARRAEANATPMARHRLLLRFRVFRGAGSQRPDPAGPCDIPSKRHDKRQVHFLTRLEIEAILAVHDRTTWLGRRDHTLLLLAGGIGSPSGRSYREGTDVEKKLPALSTHLCHTCVRGTYWYLSACPELMQKAARRLDRRGQTQVAGPNAGAPGRNASWALRLTAVRGFARHVASLNPKTTRLSSTCVRRCSSQAEAWPPRSSKRASYSARATR